MNDAKAAEIRAALDELSDIRTNPSYADPKSGFRLRARDIELKHEFGESAPDWLRDLLDERDRLRKVANAGTKLYNDLRTAYNDYEINLALDAYESALDSAGQGE